jgi:hypothetical protein
MKRAPHARVSLQINHGRRLLPPKPTGVALGHLPRVVGPQPTPGGSLPKIAAAILGSSFAVRDEPHYPLIRLAAFCL